MSLENFLTVGETLLVRGTPRVVKAWAAEWSLSPRRVPHRLFVLWEGETKYERFEAVGNDFEELERDTDWRPIASGTVPVRNPRRT